MFRDFVTEFLIIQQFKCFMKCFEPCSSFCLGNWLGEPKWLCFFSGRQHSSPHNPGRKRSLLQGLWPGCAIGQVVLFPGELWADHSCGQVPLSPACPCSLVMNLASLKIHHKSILSVSIILLFTRE